MELRLLLLLLLCSIAGAKEFTLAHKLPTRKTIEGETLGASVLKEQDSLLYIYNNSDGAVTIYRKDGTYHGTVHPQSIGRNGYLGDDFAIAGDTLYFLNTVDNRIEFFHLPSGRHMTGWPIPLTLFADEEPVNQIPLSISVMNGAIQLGNREKVVSFHYPHETISRRELSGKNRVEGTTYSFKVTLDSLICEVTR